MPTFTESIDTLYGIANDSWEMSRYFFGYVPEIRWQGREVPGIPASDKVWARISSQIVTDQQSAFANSNGKRLYHAKGLLYIQLFCPRTDADLSKGLLFAQFIREFYRKQSPDGLIWFTNQKIVELAPTNSNYPINISTTFEYDNVSGIENFGNLMVLIMTAGRHLPVESFDGDRSVFTFPGIPSDQNFYVIIYNGSIQHDLAQTGETIDLGIAPAANDNNILFAIY